tara:strand:+ start:302 stop:1210 length:909 start_codon:yes stop_codon:yes gene_type:complete
MRFAVTGGAGFVGSHLVKLLIKKGHEVVVVDNLHTGKKENLLEVMNEIEFYNMDIRNYDLLEKKLVDLDGIFHQAALTVVQDSFRNPEEYHDVNVQGTENIFKIAQKNELKVVFASSSSVYGHQDKIPISEDAKKNPINPYGKTKLDDEYLMKKYSKLGVDIIGLRYFNIFGEGQTIDYAGVITKFIDRIKDGKAPIIFGDGSQVRDFIYVQDIAEMNLIAMESNVENYLVNVGTGRSISILELANVMIKISGLKLEPIMEDPLEGDVKQSQADTGLVESVFKWKAESNLENWLKNNIFKQN